MTRILPVLPTAVLALVLAVPAAAHAQVPTLGRVDSLVTAGEYESARSTLERWWSARDQFDVPGSDMARALMLRGRLAPDPKTAEPDYLAVVLGYPASSYAPQALLRLGQGLLTTGDAARAAAYLQRLVADHPGRPERLEGLLWLSRASTAARRPAAACSAARAGLEDARDPDLTAMLRAEVEVSCTTAAGAATDVAGAPAPGVATPPATGPVTPPRTEPASGAPNREVPVSATGDWAVQTGAFRQRTGADALMERLRSAGFSSRLVLVPRNDLLRVRVGRFASRDEAARVADRLRRQGFEALPVRDAAQERQP